MKRFISLICFLLFVLMCFVGCDFNSSPSSEDKKDGVTDDENSNSQVTPDNENDNPNDAPVKEENKPEIEEGQTLFYSKSEIMFLHSSDSACEDAAFSLVGSFVETLIYEQSISSK